MLMVVAARLPSHEATVGEISEEASKRAAEPFMVEAERRKTNGKTNGKKTNGKKTKREIRGRRKSTQQQN